MAVKPYWYVVGWHPGRGRVYWGGSPEKWVDWGFNAKRFGKRREADMVRIQATLEGEVEDLYLARWPAEIKAE